MEQDQKVTVTNDEFKLWAEHPITKKVVKDLIGLRDMLKEYVAQGKTISVDADITTDRAVGRIEGLTELFNLFENVEDDMKEAPEYGH